ncbi:uncharacterized protein LOC115231856 [Octopus sinensis]|uniref:Uncharacterized protein LOC115231856 n=1 Tax=Octopus sinensis TaxID=2607531 RepID=A0A6P7U5N4_9MOLL|nr:uncharacterized protein LOC115231856 [Octopus sinensis]
MCNTLAEIRVDTTIPTELKIQYNKPDIFFYDKRENLIWLIEVGVTSIDNLKSVEVEKLHKYDILASELQLIHKTKVKIVPIVITWDGIVSTIYRKYMELLGIKERVRSYIQTVTLRATLESMFVEYKHGFSEILDSANSVNRDWRKYNFSMKISKSLKRPRDCTPQAEIEDYGEEDQSGVMGNSGSKNLRVV